jgi:hypothetical protein
VKPLDPADRDALIEEVVSAHRERDPRGGGFRSSPAFWDLDEAGRLEAADAAARARVLEAALDPEGRSTTVLAVLAILRGR